MPLLSVIVPTYMEAPNVPVLVKRLDETCREASISYELIFVDDNSGDGIEKIVWDMAARGYPVRIKVRAGEKGLSSAVLAGFKLAQGKIFCVMDGDLSHPPEKIPELMGPLLSGEADFVLASRFAHGGGIPFFNSSRRLNALVARMLARPFSGVSDPMSGFFALPEFLVNGVTLNPVGFKIGLEIIVRCRPENIREIPFVFQERLYGESKLTLKEQLLYLLHLRRLLFFRYRSFSELIHYVAVGISGVLVDLTTLFIAFDILENSFRTARVAGFMTAVTSNFLLNRNLTFPEGRALTPFRQYLRYLAVCSVGFVVNWFISVYLYEHNLFFNRYYLLAAFLGVLGGMVVNFTGSKLLVFYSYARRGKNNKKGL